MIKKILIILVLMFGSYFLYSYSSENTKYEILNEIIQDNNMTYIDKICSKPLEINVNENNLTEFSLFSQLSVNFQKITQFGFSFKSKKIKYFKKTLNKTIYCEVKSDCDNEGEFIYKLSEPIISTDKKTVLLKITEDCNCMLGGESNTAIYKKINGKWKKVKTIVDWIS